MGDPKVGATRTKIVKEQYIYMMELWAMQVSIYLNIGSDPGMLPEYPGPGVSPVPRLQTVPLPHERTGHAYRASSPNI